MTKTFTPARPIWCAGCGDFGVLKALENALDYLEIPRHKSLVVAGIGCSGNLQNNLASYGYHALHGRVLPTATGAKLANPELAVIGVGGDGDGFAIGGNHLLHTFKRNPSIAYIIMNNGTYGLTKGQPSPTSITGYRNNIEEDLDAVLVGISIPGTTFLARAYSGQLDQLTRLTIAALEHTQAGKGLAYLEVLSPCVTYNDTYRQWRTSVYDVDQDESYNPHDRAVAFPRLMELRRQGRLPIGLLYHGQRHSFESKILSAEHPAPALQDIHAKELRERYETVLQSFMS